MTTTTATAASMPSGYLSNLKLASDERKRIWDSLTSDRQAEAAAKFADPTVDKAKSKFSSLGEALAYDYSKSIANGDSKNILNQDISVQADDISSDSGSKIGALVNFDSMDSAIFVDIQQGNYPTAADPSWITDETTKQKYLDAYTARAYDAYKTAADKFGGFDTQGMLGYDSNSNGFLDNESELFGFGTRGLTTSDFFDNTNDPTKYVLNDYNATSNQAISASRFMILGPNGESTAAISTSYDSGNPQFTTSVTMDLLDKTKGQTVGTAATVNINVTET